MVDSAALTQADAIQRFWLWWERVAVPADAAMRSGDHQDFIEALDRQVAAIDPRLTWEFGEGNNAAHHLCVTGAGNPECRTIAERWFRKAPPTCDRWEYAPSRQPSKRALTAAIEFGGHRVEIGETRFDVRFDEHDLEVSLTVFNPALASITQQQREEICFVICDAVLGEDAVERWVGSIDIGSHPSQTPVPAEALAEIIAELELRNPKPRWALFEATTPEGGRRVVRSLQPIKRAAYPLFDLYGVVTVSFGSERADGMPQGKTVDNLEALERSLGAALGPDGVLVAVETTSQTRKLYLYCDSHSTTPESIAEDCERINGVTIEWWLDPAWDGVRRLHR